MAIEDLLTGLTTALNRNSDLLEKVLTAGKAGSPGQPTGEKANPPRAAEQPSDAKAATKAPAAPKGASKTKAPTEADIRSAFGSYLSVEARDEREARKANVKAILDHFGVNKATELPEENRAEAIGYINAFANGETPNFMADDGEGEDGEDALV